MSGRLEIDLVQSQLAPRCLLQRAVGATGVQPKVDREAGRLAQGGTVSVTGHRLTSVG